MTTRSTCSTRRPVAACTVRVTRELCGLECPERRRRGGAVADRAGGRKRDRKTHQRRETVKSEDDGILLADSEWGERPLDEENQCDRDECAQRDRVTADRACGHAEEHDREDVHDPARAIAEDGPLSPAG